MIGTTPVDESGFPKEIGAINGEFGHAAYFKDLEGNILGLRHKI